MRFPVNDENGAPSQSQHPRKHSADVERFMTMGGEVAWATAVYHNMQTADRQQPHVTDDALWDEFMSPDAPVGDREEGPAPETQDVSQAPAPTDIDPSAAALGVPFSSLSLQANILGDEPAFGTVSRAVECVPMDVDPYRPVTLLGPRLPESLINPSRTRGSARPNGTINPRDVHRTLSETQQVAQPTHGSMQPWTSPEPRPGPSNASMSAGPSSGTKRVNKSTAKRAAQDTQAPPFGEDPTPSRPRKTKASARMTSRRIPHIAPGSGEQFSLTGVFGHAPAPPPAPPLASPAAVQDVPQPRALPSTVKTEQVESRVPDRATTPRDKGKGVIRSKASTRSARAKPYSHDPPPVRRNIMGKKKDGVNPTNPPPGYELVCCKRRGQEDWTWDGQPLPSTWEPWNVWDNLREIYEDVASTKAPCRWRGCEGKNRGTSGLKRHIEGTHLKLKFRCTGCRSLTNRYDNWSKMKHKPGCSVAAAVPQSAGKGEVQQAQREEREEEQPGDAGTPNPEEDEEEDDPTPSPDA
ncbi:hypothetical protein OH77DRAFT_793250 [Trametes cingulata]|nr:hypothetical protein OH77DRAFT_793250 [Trametes cingulata]